MNDTVTIIIEGAIGVGKTTLIKQLAKKLKNEGKSYELEWEFTEQDSELKKLINEFYDKPWTVAIGEILQNKIIQQRKQQIKDRKHVQYRIMERSVLSTRIFAEGLYSMEYITGDQRARIQDQTKQEYYDHYTEYRNKGTTIVIYLEPTVEIMLKQVQGRDNDKEKFERLKKYYKTIYKTYTKEIKEVYPSFQKEKDIPHKDSQEYETLIQRMYNKMNNTYLTKIKNYAICLLYKEKKWINKYSKKEGSEPVIYLSKRINILKPGEGQSQVAGGRIEYGETAKEAAIREVKEETGIQLKEKQLQFIGIHDNVEGLGINCTMFMAKLEKHQTPKRMEPENNEDWEQYTVLEAFTEPSIKLTPTLKHFELLIQIKIEGYKNPRQMTWATRRQRSSVKNRSSRYNRLLKKPKKHPQRKPRRY